jgi:hypothetical protein
VKITDHRALYPQAAEVHTCRRWRWVVQHTLSKNTLVAVSKMGGLKLGFGVLLMQQIWDTTVPTRNMIV